MPKIMTPTIEKYAFKICSIMNEVRELERIIEQRKGIGSYSAPNSDKVIVETILKLQNARIELEKAYSCLVSRIRKD
jgi:hypothetical protein